MIDSSALELSLPVLTSVTGDLDLSGNGARAACDLIESLRPLLTCELVQVQPTDCL